MKHIHLVLLASFVASGCSVEQIAVPRMRPAEVNMSKYHKIAIDQIDGENGDQFGDELTQAILDSHRFDVVDDGPTDVVVVGHINKRWYDQSQNSVEGTCYNLKEKYACYSQSTTGKWDSQASLRLIDTSTNKLITMKSLSAGDQKTASDTTVDNSVYPDPTWDVDGVFGDLQHQMVSEFMRAIVPYSVVVRVALYTDSDIPELGRGVTFAKNGDWGNAISSFRNAAAQADASPDAKPELKARCHYDYAIALGYSGQDFALADREIGQAIQLKPDQVYYQERVKIAAFKKDDDTLKNEEAGDGKHSSHGPKGPRSRG